MPHIPYMVPPPPGESALVDAIRARRGGRLLNLDLMLLHSPPFASGWNTFLREVRQHLALDPVLRELAICHIALLNAAEYEWRACRPTPNGSSRLTGLRPSGRCSNLPAP